MCSWIQAPPSSRVLKVILKLAPNAPFSVPVETAPVVGNSSNIHARLQYCNFGCNVAQYLMALDLPLICTVIVFCYEL